MNDAELVRRYTEEFKNHSNFDVVDEVCSENFVHHLPIPGIPEGRAGFKALGQFVTGAIGDITVTIELIVADDGIVANRNRARGTRKADGKEMNWIEHEFWRVENGRLAEQWSVADGLDIG